MENIPTYVAREHGKEPVEYLHPKLEPIVGETYGIMIYQEQVMQAAQVIAGYSLGGADLLRRAMGKKKVEEMDKQRAIFLEGAGQNGISEQTPSISSSKWKSSRAMASTSHTRLPMRLLLTKQPILRRTSQSNSWPGP